jgi:general secretion pathway protein G
MKKIYGSLYRKQEGFTLVELMIVIIILAILTAIAVPSYMVLRNRARTAAAQSELKNIATALEMFYADWEQYPPTGFAALINELTGDAAATVNTTGEEYMNPVPATDPWGVSYVYTLAAGSYTVESYGADGADAGGDDIEVIDGQLQ